MRRYNTADMFQGTGGSPSLGNFPIFPLPDCPGDEIDRCQFTKRSRRVRYNLTSVKAEPGYFELALKNGIGAKMTTSRCAALFKFFFPDAVKHSVILLDMTDLHDSRTSNSSASVDRDTGRMRAASMFKPSFGIGEYKAFVCVDFRGAGISQAGVFIDNRPSSKLHNLVLPDREITNSFPIPGGFWAQFSIQADPSILARVGVSFISVTQACHNAEKEIPDVDFDLLKDTAQQGWQQKLDPIRVSPEGLKDTGLLKSFYSGIYRTMIDPQDYTGENARWKRSKEPYFDSFYW